MQLLKVTGGSCCFGRLRGAGVRGELEQEQEGEGKSAELIGALLVRFI